MGNIANKFIEQINEYGFDASVISIKHINELQYDIENIQNKYEDVNINLSRYLNKFDYEILKKFPEASSIIVIAVPQPIVRIHFTLGSKKHAVIMPPMYLFNSSVECEYKQENIAKITAVMNRILTPQNYKVMKTNLPCKPAAVRSGLGVYGKNNICYINGQSSFYWLGVYVSDMPCENLPLKNYSTMYACKNCGLCLKNCPTGAISNDRFIVHADKCITLQNESSNDFKNWIEPKWHNSIIGCMRCQIICPVNKNSIRNIKDLAEFDDLETKMILAGTPLSELSALTYEKLEEINFIEDYDLLARNLNVLIKNKSH